MREKYLNEIEWSRVRAYVREKTAAELVDVHKENLGKVLNAVARGKKDIRGVQALSSARVKEIFVYCKPTTTETLP